MIERTTNKTFHQPPENCKHPAFSISGGLLLCVSCGTPSRSPEWRRNTYGQAQAEAMDRAEEAVRRMTEKEKTEVIQSVLNPQDSTLLRFGAHEKLTYTQYLICFERKIRRPEDLPENTLDASIIRQLAPENLKHALAEAKARLEKAEGLLRQAQELRFKTVEKHRKIGSATSDLSFFQGVPQEMIDRYNATQNKKEMVDELVKEAGRDYDARRIKHNCAAAALDDWVRVEQARRRESMGRKDESNLTLVDRPASSLEKRIAEAQDSIRGG